MKTKTFLISWIPSFIVIFGLNGLFHTVLFAKYFDAHLAHFQPHINQMVEGNPLWVALLDLIISFSITYFIHSKQIGKIAFTQAAFIGGLINFTTSFSWNFVNATMFKNWPMKMSIFDVAWHVTLGVFGGILIGLIYNKSQK